jgi:ATP-dependent exoDNAse (exonuclease V) beta subunit
VSGTLLHRLWPVISDRYSDYAGEPGTPEYREDWVQPVIKRFPSGWTNLAAPASISVGRHPRHVDDDNEVTFDWAGSVAMRVGLVVHRCLQYIAEAGPAAWADRNNEAALRAMLLEEGVSLVELDDAFVKVSHALKTTLQDKQGQWILSDQHEQSVCEYPVTMLEEGNAVHFVIDRSFVDNKGDRWIVDYKTSSHEGGDVEAFIDAEVVRYKNQMERYRDVMLLLEPERNIRTALYFPLLGEFRELE